MSCGMNHEATSCSHPSHGILTAQNVVVAMYRSDCGVVIFFTVSVCSCRGDWTNGVSKALLNSNQPTSWMNCPLFTNKFDAVAANQNYTFTLLETHHTFILVQPTCGSGMEYCLAVKVPCDWWRLYCKLELLQCAALLCTSAVMNTSHFSAQVLTKDLIQMWVMKQIVLILKYMFSVVWTCCFLWHMRMVDVYGVFIVGILAAEREGYSACKMMLHLHVS